MSKWLAIIPTLLLAHAPILHADDVDQWLNAISKTGADAAGSRAARAAADQLRGLGVVQTCSSLFGSVRFWPLVIDSLQLLRLYHGLHQLSEQSNFLSTQLSHII